MNAKDNGEETLQPALYLVPTPIGNMDDITLRALKVLNRADIIACEDTRRTGILLKRHDIKAKKIVNYREQNERKQAKRLVEEIKSSKSVALASDAGYPLISDPGYRIVQAAIENEIKIIPLPGCAAFVPALAASGLPVDKFVFLGFPPHKKGRQTFIKNLSEYDSTVILYESPYRIKKLLDEISEHLGDETQICLAREISKKFEEFIRGAVGEVKESVGDKNVKGEFVVVIGR